ncbi:hypothetical protein HER21_34510, partial [Pseudomonas sp. BGM005]|nr:hypothetical protein [Pseudomonas sp. BG5]
MNSRRTPRALLASGFALLTIASLAACSTGAAEGGDGGAGSGATGTDPESFTVLSANENTTLATELDALAEGACKA